MSIYCAVPRERERLYDIPWYLTDVNLLCSTKREGEAIRYPMVPHRCQFIVQYQERGRGYTISHGTSQMSIYCAVPRERERLYDIPWYLTDVNLLCSTKREGEAIRYPMVPHRCQFIVQYQERGRGYTISHGTSQMSIYCAVPRERERLYDIPWYLTDVNLLCSTKREGEAIRYPMVPHRCQFIVQYQERGSFACAKLALNVASLVQSVCKMFLHFRKACAKYFFTCAKLVLSVHNGNKLKSLKKKKKKIKQNDC